LVKADEADFIAAGGFQVIAEAGTGKAGLSLAGGRLRPERRYRPEWDQPGR
jgi:hypothetical protein